MSNVDYLLYDLAFHVELAFGHAYSMSKSNETIYEADRFWNRLFCHASNTLSNPNPNPNANARFKNMSLVNVIWLTKTWKCK